MTVVRGASCGGLVRSRRCPGLLTWTRGSCLSIPPAPGGQIVPRGVASPTGIGMGKLYGRRGGPADLKRRLWLPSAHGPPRGAGCTQPLLSWQMGLGAPGRSLRCGHHVVASHGTVIPTWYVVDIAQTETRARTWLAVARSGASPVRGDRTRAAGAALLRQALAGLRTGAAFRCAVVMTKVLACVRGMGAPTPGRKGDPRPIASRPVAHSRQHPCAGRVGVLPRRSHGSTVSAQARGAVCAGCSAVQGGRGSMAPHATHALAECVPWTWCAASGGGVRAMGRTRAARAGLPRIEEEVRLRERKDGGLAGTRDLVVAGEVPLRAPAGVGDIVAGGRHEARDCAELIWDGWPWERPIRVPGAYLDAPCHTDGARHVA